MRSFEDAVISIKPHYANAILSGAKTVELRRRIPSVAVGTRFWIYATRPKGAIIGTAILRDVVRDTPANLWRTLGSRSGVDCETFDNYFTEIDFGFGLVLGDAQAIQPIELGELRAYLHGFHPPQVLSRLSDDASSFLLKLAFAS